MHTRRCSFTECSPIASHSSLTRSGISCDGVKGSDISCNGVEGSGISCDGVEGSGISCNGVKETDTCEEYPSMSMMQPIVSSAGNRIFAVRKPKPTTFFLSFTTVTLNERTSEFLQFTSWLYSLG